MPETQIELARLAARLERLERSNRRWRYSALAGMLALPLFVAIAAVPATAPGVIRAHKFELIDGKGNTRAELEMEAIAGVGEQPDLHMRGSNVVAGDFGASMNSNVAADITPLGMVLFDFHHQTSTDVNAGSISAQDFKKNAVTLGIDRDLHGPVLSVMDSAGYRTDIGVTGLITPESGEAHTTSAASIVMFGKEDAVQETHRVIWSAPH